MRPGVAMLLLCVTSAVAAEAPTASLQVAERVFDAGKVYRGVTVRHQFLLKNVGTAELGIDAKPG